MGSKGWEFRKVGNTFPYFLFLVSYSLFHTVLAPLRETRNFVPLCLRDFVSKKMLQAFKLRGLKPSLQTFSSKNTPPPHFLQQ